MPQGTIRELLCFSMPSDSAKTKLISVHNGAGVGYIASLDGDAFFDASALTNRWFAELKKEMLVEYVLDNTAFRRASSVTVIEERTNSGLDDVSVSCVRADTVVEDRNNTDLQDASVLKIARFDA